MFVRDLINKNPAVCTEDLPLEQVYKLMQEKDSDNVVVIESKAHRIPIGVVTEHEICMQVVGRGRSPRGMTAANVMNTNFVKADLESDLSECRQRRTGHRPVIVIDENGALQGVLPEDLNDPPERNTIPERLFKNVLPPSPVAVFDRIF